MVLDRDFVLRSVNARADEFRRRGVRRLGLFGSVARGEARPDSDLGFVVELERKSFDDFMEVRFLLEDMFGRKIDLVPIDRIKPAIRERILSDVVDAPGF